MLLRLPLAIGLFLLLNTSNVYAKAISPGFVSNPEDFFNRDGVVPKSIELTSRAQASGTDLRAVIALDHANKEGDAAASSELERFGITNITNVFVGNGDRGLAGTASTSGVSSGGAQADKPTDVSNGIGPPNVQSTSTGPNTLGGNSTSPVGNSNNPQGLGPTFSANNNTQVGSQEWLGNVLDSISSFGGKLSSGYGSNSGYGSQNSDFNSGANEFRAMAQRSTREPAGSPTVSIPSLPAPAGVSPPVVVASSGQPQTNTPRPATLSSGPTSAEFARTFSEVKTPEPKPTPGDTKPPHIEVAKIDAGDAKPKVGPVTTPDGSSEATPPQTGTGGFGNKQIGQGDGSTRSVASICVGPLNCEGLAQKLVPLLSRCTDSDFSVTQFKFCSFSNLVEVAHCSKRLNEACKKEVSLEIGKSLKIFLPTGSKLEGIFDFKGEARYDFVGPPAPAHSSAPTPGSNPPPSNLGPGVSK